MQKKWEKQMRGAGVFQYGFVTPAEIEYRQMIRDICEGNTCRQYGKTWGCPPAVGTVQECKSRCVQYNTLLVFTGKFTLEDSFDYEGMIHGMKAFKEIARGVDAAVKPYLKKYLVLSNEGCDTCERCTYPESPCRFPEKLHHSIEGYGILVSELAQQAGVNYNNGENTVTYFGAVLFDDVDAENIQ